METFGYKIMRYRKLTGLQNCCLTVRFRPELRSWGKYVSGAANVRHFLDWLLTGGADADLSSLVSRWNIADDDYYNCLFVD